MGRGCSFPKGIRITTWVPYLGLPWRVLTQLFKDTANEPGLQGSPGYSQPVPPASFQNMSVPKYVITSKTLHWDTWTKTIKRDINLTSFWGLCFQRSSLAWEQKTKIALTQEKQSSKKRGNISKSFMTNVLYWNNRKYAVLRETHFLLRCYNERLKIRQKLQN